MSLVSLYQMGATADRMQQFYDNYVKRLEPAVPSAGFINANNWRHYLGQRKFYNDYRDFFQAEKKRLDGNLRLLVAEYMPMLMEG
jgi:hypothetical protein